MMNSNKLMLKNLNKQEEGISYWLKCLLNGSLKDLFFFRMGG